MFKQSDFSCSLLVSVIIPTFNRVDLVVHAIDSVLNQTYPFFEIIVVDDCSTDNTISVLSKYGERISLVKNEINSYVGFARNYGVTFAKGDYVAFLDSDDTWLPDKLELQMKWMRKNNFQISATGFYTFQQNLKPIEEKVRPYSENLRLIDVLYGVYIAPGSTLIINKEIFISLNGYDVSYRRLEDWDLIIRIYLQNHTVSYFNHPTAIIKASNEYTINNLQNSGKKLFFLNFKSLFKFKWYYPAILLVGICFELFVVYFRAKKYFFALFYFLMFNLICFFQHPYFRIHFNTTIRILKKRFFILKYQD